MLPCEICLSAGPEAPLHLPHRDPAHSCASLFGSQMATVVARALPGALPGGATAGLKRAAQEALDHVRAQPTNGLKFEVPGDLLKDRPDLVTTKTITASIARAVAHSNINLATLLHRTTTLGKRHILVTDNTVTLFNPRGVRSYRCGSPPGLS